MLLHTLEMFFGSFRPSTIAGWNWMDAESRTDFTSRIACCILAWFFAIEYPASVPCARATFALRYL